MVSADTRQTPQGFEPVGDGTPIVVEAWCYDVTKTEIGYVKKDGLINEGPGGLSATVIPFSSSLGEECLVDTSRGRYPCIRSRVFKP